MVHWYDPRLLVATGIRAAISEVFGHFADKREAIAAANAIRATPADEDLDYSQAAGPDGFWFDYLADTGDGWNPTYAMARLVTERALSPTGSTTELARGRLLILGGDQVYPTASIEEYRERFLQPFDEAYARAGASRWEDSDGSRPHLYAIPGNHDWYDGLNAFFGTFCRRRVTGEGELGVSRKGKVIGGRETRQTRSYFALELPHNWWVWGTDSQLEGYIDQPQVDYFQHAASSWMKDGARLILCVPDPSWAYVDPDHVGKKFDSFSYLERLAETAVDPDTGRSKQHRLKAVLTGDSHHYARYDEDGERQYIVCGGGGAVLHPTHHLTDKVFDYRFPKPGSAGDGPCRRSFRIARKGDGSEALFPGRRTSRHFAWRNLGFAALNPTFVGLLGITYLIFNWILDFNAKALRAGGTLASSLDPGTYADALGAYGRLILVSPWAPILVLAAVGGYHYFADSPYSHRIRFLMGALHAAAQGAAVTGATIAIVRETNQWWASDGGSAASLLLASFASAVLSSVVFGLYLLISLRWFGKHPNEGFSSLRIEGYKSFLRLHIDAVGTLSIHPIGLRKVPKDDGETSQDPPLEPEMIDDVIRIS
jgi:3',5'-cyclic AMP phosphodiesterase CpdA